MRRGAILRQDARNAAAMLAALEAGERAQFVHLAGKVAAALSGEPAVRR